MARIKRAYPGRPDIRHGQGQAPVQAITLRQVPPRLHPRPDAVAYTMILGNYNVEATGSPVTVASVGTYDLTGSYVAIQIGDIDQMTAQVTVTVTNGSLSAGFRIFGAAIGQFGGVTQYPLQPIGANEEPQPGNRTFTVNRGGYIRLRESDDVLVWEASPDGNDWTTVYINTVPFSLTAIQLTITAVPTSDAVAYTMILGNYNVVPYAPSAPTLEIPSQPDTQ